MSFEDNSLDFKAKEGVLENKVKSKDRELQTEKSWGQDIIRNLFNLRGLGGWGNKV